MLLAPLVQLLHIPADSGGGGGSLFSGPPLLTLYLMLMQCCTLALTQELMPVAAFLILPMKAIACNSANLDRMHDLWVVRIWPLWEFALLLLPCCDAPQVTHACYACASVCK